MAALTNPPWPEWSRPKPATDAYFPAWILCDQCREATDNVRVAENRFEISCRNHQFSHEVGLPSRDFKFSPKVVLRQPLAALLNLEHRVCGNRLGYWQVADELVQTLFSVSPPPRFPITGGVRFDGMTGMLAGAPPLLRVLAETPVRDLLDQLFVPNDADVIVHNRSPHPESSDSSPAP
ncbi:MAG: hypothetical protein EXS35_05535 [Pedosphaera sp.]|nr:hypothetical protein [Pedosphaera sp.]